MIRAHLIEIVEPLHEEIRNIVKMVVTPRIPGEIHLGRRRKNNHIRILLLDGVVEHLESVRSVRRQSVVQVILVPDFDESDLPWLRVTDGCAPGAVFGIDGPGQELELVECVLDVNVQFVFRDDVAVEGEAGPDAEDWGG